MTPSSISDVFNSTPSTNDTLDILTESESQTLNPIISSLSQIVDDHHEDHSASPPPRVLRGDEPLELHSEEYSPLPKVDHLTSLVSEIRTETHSPAPRNQSAPLHTESSLGLNLPPRPSNRFCTTSTDCHLDLNERCVSQGTFSVCDCREPFLRDAATNSCEIKRAVRIGVKFCALSFTPELSKKNTPLYIRMKELAEKTIMSIVAYSPVLALGVSEARVSDFSDGSLQATCYLFVRESLYRRGSMEALSLLLVKEISVAVHELNATKDASPAYDMVVTELDTAINPCALSELNYCSDEAVCVPSKYGFACKCDERFTDTSPHPAFPGETCSIECPESYCQNGGHCHVGKRDAVLYCTCNNWNVGARCQYSGIVVFSVLGVVVVLLLFVVGCTASAFCGHRASMQENAIQYSKPVTPNYNEEHIRPFRITIDNPFDSMQPAELPMQNNNIQNDKRTRPSPRPSLDENTHYALSSAASRTPSPKPRLSPRLSVAAIQTDIAPIISIINESGEPICETRGGPVPSLKVSNANVAHSTRKSSASRTSPTQTHQPQITWF